MKDRNAFGYISADASPSGWQFQHDHQTYWTPSVRSWGKIRAHEVTQKWAYIWKLIYMYKTHWAFFTTRQRLNVWIHYIITMKEDSCTFMSSFYFSVLYLNKSSTYLSELSWWIIYFIFLGKPDDLLNHQNPHFCSGNFFWLRFL